MESNLSNTKPDSKATPIQANGSDHTIVSSAAPVSQQTRLYKSGDVIDGRYEIRELVGKGGMCVVYRARHLKMERDVALKMLHRHLVRDKTILDRFLQEARAESTLKHPNVISVNAVGVTEDGQLFIAMDFIQGRSLADLLRIETQLPEPLAKDIFLQICAGLAHAHEHDVIHRDLKPSNVMLVGSGADLCAKIVDFGIAKLAVPQNGQRLTQTGNIVGSPPYMSPEQCMGKQLDKRSDIYSLGCLMYECLSGRTPFEGDSPLETMSCHVSEQPRSLVEAGIAVNPVIDEIVLRCLEKDPDKRFSTVGDVVNALESWEPHNKRQEMRAPTPARVPAPVKGSAHRARPGRIRTRLGWRAAAAVVCVTVLIALVAYKPLSTLYDNAVRLPALDEAVRVAQHDHGSNSPQFVEAILKQGDFCYASGRIAMAQFAYQAAILHLPAGTPAQKARAAELIQRAYGDQAAQKYAAALDLYHRFSAAHDPLNAEAMLVFAGYKLPDAPISERVAALEMLSDMLIYQQRAGQAFRVLSDAIGLLQDKSIPGRATMLGDLYVRIGQQFIEINDRRRARQAFAQALQYLPSTTDAQRRIRATIEMKYKTLSQY